MLAVFGAALVLVSAGAAAAGSLKDFGRCLAREGATFYGASWCPHCQSQRQMLGEAMDAVRYVECSVDGGRGGTSPECAAAGVDSFPTWIFGDGSRVSGAQSVGRLAARTGCPLPSEGGESASGRSAAPARASSGPKIIEVPQ